MSPPNGRTIIYISSFSGQPPVAELEREAAADQRPRKDYVELARRLHAPIVDYSEMRLRAGRIGCALASTLGLEYGQLFEALTRRRRYDHVVMWGDRLGLPLALGYKLTGYEGDLVMFGFLLNEGTKPFWLRHLRVHTHLRSIILNSRRQYEMASRIGVPPEKLRLEPASVDDAFWRPGIAPAENVISSVGATLRDYPTLIEAVRGLDVRLEADVSGVLPQHGSREARDDRLDRIVAEGLPPNVRRMSGLSLFELRRLYARSRFIVVPLVEEDMGAGFTTLAEAMSMGKAVVATRTRGAALDIIQDGVHGMYYPPGDVRALREIIEHLLAHPEEADRMGRAGRALVEERLRLDDHMDRFAMLIAGNGAPA